MTIAPFPVPPIVKSVTVCAAPARALAAERARRSSSSSTRMSEPMAQSSTARNGNVSGRS